MYDFGIFCRPDFFSIWKYEEKKRKGKKYHKYFLTGFCGLFVFQSRIYPVLGFGWCMCKYCVLWLPYCTLCSLGVTLLSNSKRGLYFCCMSVRHFSGRHVEIVFILFSLRTKRSRKKNGGKSAKHSGNKCSCQDTNLSPAWRSLFWLMIAYIVLFSALLSRLTVLAWGSTWVTSFL